MAAVDIWSSIHAERAALAEDLTSLSPDQWSAPSWCAGWSVRDVLGHLTATAKMTAPLFFVKLAGSGFRFGTMAARDIARETSGSPADGLAG